MNMKKLLQISAIMLVAVMSIPKPTLSASNNYYSRTSMYFNVPNDATFSIAFPSDFTSWVVQGNTSEPASPSTTWISFNFTAVPQATLQEPYQTGNSSNNQSNAANRPIMYIDNTGNCNEQLQIKAVGALPSNIVVYFNTTGDGTPVGTLTTLTTGYQDLVTGLPNTGFLNLTLFSNTSAGVTTGQTTQDFYIKSIC